MNVPAGLVAVEVAVGRTGSVLMVVPAVLMSWGIVLSVIFEMLSCDAVARLWWTQTD